MLLCLFLLVRCNCLGYGWLLLSNAMNGAQAPDQIGTANPNDLSRRKKLLQSQNRALVVGALVGWDKYGPIGNVEVRVTCRETIAIVFNRAGHGEGNHTQRATGLIRHELQ